MSGNNTSLHDIQPTAMINLERKLNLLTDQPSFTLPEGKVVK